MSIANLFQPNDYNLDCASLTLSSSGAVTPGQLKYYEVYDSTFTFTGIWATNPTCTVSFTRLGNIVTMTFLTAIVAAGAQAGVITSVTAIPTRFLPAFTITLNFSIPIYTGGAAVFGSLTINQNSGIIAIYNGPVGSIFDEGGQAGFPPLSVTYSLS